MTSKQGQVDKRKTFTPSSWAILFFPMGFLFRPMKVSKMQICCRIFFSSPHANKYMPLFFIRNHFMVGDIISAIKFC